jgi:hypothetical protein
MAIFNPTILSIKLSKTLNQVQNTKSNQMNQANLYFLKIKAATLFHKKYLMSKKNVLSYQNTLINQTAI